MGSLLQSPEKNGYRLAYWSRISFIKYVCAVLAGSLLPFAFAPFHFWPISLLAPLILLWLWQKSAHPFQAFWLGFFFGIGFFGLGVSWVFVGIHNYGNAEVPLALFITALFVVVLSLFIAIQGYLLKRFFCGGILSFCLLGFPSIWVIFEWVRSFLFEGFPWVYLGYAGLDTPLRNMAPIFSVYGVSWLILFSSALLLIFFQNKGKIRISVLMVLSLTWLVTSGLSYVKFTQTISQNHSVALIQDNIDPQDKFGTEGPIGAIENTYGRLTEKHWNHDLIIWPESVIALPIPFAESFIAKLKTKALEHNASIIFGIYTMLNTQAYYNSLIMTGVNSGTYHKKRLVPFGEFLPLNKCLRGLINFFDIRMSNFIEGPSEQPLLKMGKLILAPIICYEIAFPELLQSSIRDAHVIVNLSDDSWFGATYGPHQHLQIAQMRALETGRYILRVSTPGISAIIKPDGTIEKKSPQFQSHVLTGQFEAKTGSTPWMMFGIWPLLSFCFLTFLLPGRLKTLRAPIDSCLMGFSVHKNLFRKNQIK